MKDKEQTFGEFVGKALEPKYTKAQFKQAVIEAYNKGKSDVNSDYLLHMDGKPYESISGEQYYNNKFKDNE